MQSHSFLCLYIGERCVLMGLIQGAFKAQYDVLRAHGHSPSEAYNETIEEALCSLYPLVAEVKGFHSILRIGFIHTHNKSRTLN